MEFDECYFCGTINKTKYKTLPTLYSQQIEELHYQTHTHIIMVDLCMGDSGNSFRGGRIYLYH